MNAVAFGGVVASADEYGVGFLGEMVLRFGDFAGEVDIGTGIDGSLKIVLCAARAPNDVAQDFVGIAGDNGFAAEYLVEVGGQFGGGVLVFGQGAGVEQVLVAETAGVCPAALFGQLGVVADFGVGVKRQVIAGHVDVVGEQGGDALFFPAGDDGGFAFPEHAVVDEQQVGLLGGGVFDGGAAGGYGSDDAADVAAAFDLQAVGSVVLVSVGLQGGAAEGKQFVAVGHGGSLVAWRVRRVNGLV